MSEAELQNAASNNNDVSYKPARIPAQSQSEKLVRALAKFV